MVRFVPAPDPAARALKMGLARESSFFLISRFKGMRGVGKRGEAPAACPGKRARAPFPGVGRRSKCSAVRIGLGYLLSALQARSPGRARQEPRMCHVLGWRRV